MPEQPTLTVLMSVYNAGRFVARAVESVLWQTFVDFEFIMIDDGSTDDSPQVLERFRDRRIRLLRNPSNCGLAFSLNRGLSEARGRYIARQDADDISEPQRFERQIRELESHPEIGLLGSYFYLIDTKGLRLRLRKVHSGSSAIKEALVQRNQFCHGAVMFRRDAAVAVGGYRSELQCSQDYDLWLRMSEHCEVDNLAEPLYNFRITLQSVSMARRFEQERSSGLVKELARLRRQGQNITDPREVRDLLAKRPVRSAREAHDIVAESCYRWSEVFYLAGSLGEAARWLYESVRARWSMRALVLFVKICLCRILPAKAVRWLKSLRGEQAPDRGLYLPE